MTSWVGGWGGARRCALVGANGTAGCPSAPTVAYAGHFTSEPGGSVICAAGSCAVGASRCVPVQPLSAATTVTVTAATRLDVTRPWSSLPAPMTRQVDRRVSHRPIERAGPGNARRWPQLDSQHNVARGRLLDVK